MISHLWKCASGFLQVDDSFTFEKLEELRFIKTNEGAPLNRRRITFLGSDEKELFVENLKCDITVTHDCLVMFTTHDGFAKNLVSCFYIDGRGLTKLETAMSVPLRSDEESISAKVFQPNDSDMEQDSASLLYQHSIFDSASQSTIANLIYTPAGTSAIDEDRDFEAALSTNEREASLKQREQEMDNREREIAEQERNLVLKDPQSSEKIDIAHLEARLSDIFRAFEEKLTSKTVNDGIEDFEVMGTKLAGYDRAIKNRHTDVSAREIALARFQLAMEKLEGALTEREESAKKLEVQIQERENLARSRAQELETLSRSLRRRDELLNERETELAARDEANIRLREQLDADREILDAREAAMEQGLRDDYERYDTSLYDCEPYSSYEDEDEDEEREEAEDFNDHYYF
ncbi:uncharacterized protein EAF02_009846 [Botrytis sinoallii]|uniref:uncharacterized protein n=1 Tax=Botrytis sinoallii TaxID=1463999 RepID=UPI001900AC51|nr:uncharacterized protein EAF02_009846 [Botrytis sinoallii]KAF7867060.1 hypothetical protein EAF02_009846 [Botrytis sinoallii]